MISLNQIIQIIFKSIEKKITTTTTITKTLLLLETKNNNEYKEDNDNENFIVIDYDYQTEQLKLYELDQLIDVDHNDSKQLNHHHHLQRSISITNIKEVSNLVMSTRTQFYKSTSINCCIIEDDDDDDQMDYEETNNFNENLNQQFQIISFENFQHLQFKSRGSEGRVYKGKFNKSIKRKLKN